MKFLELINKCLVELNYKSVPDFAELNKNDHKKLINILNILNNEICSSEKWDFLQRKMNFVLPKNTAETENIVEGGIEAVYIDGVKYDYFADFEKFFMNSQPSGTYSFYDDKILFPMFNQDKNVMVLYYTNKYVNDSQGQEKSLLEDANDSSVIPDVFAEPLLVYGACMRLKGNPQHIRFSYWLSMYRDALANMRSRISASMDEAPEVKMHRK